MTENMQMPPVPGAPAPAMAPMRRSWRIVLIASLALNLMVLGLVGGAMVRGGGGMGPPRGVDLQLGFIAEALAPEDRQAIRDDLRGRESLRQHPRRDRTAMLTDLLAALRQDPFEMSAIEEAFDNQRSRFVDVQLAAQEALLARIAAMTPAARQAFADRLAEALDDDH